MEYYIAYREEGETAPAVISNQDGATRRSCDAVARASRHRTGATRIFYFFQCTHTSVDRQTESISIYTKQPGERTTK